MEPSRPRFALWAALAALVIAGVGALAWSRPAEEKTKLGLFTSLPIYWSESASVGEALENANSRHWVRQALEEEHELVPLDALEPQALAGIRELVMAQPRPLSPSENVALDDWVAGGGRLLVFADPFLTEESRFSLGDKRRPQDVVLLSPILARWGLELTFDDRQSDTINWIRYGGETIPERLAGRWKLLPQGDHSNCKLSAEGLVAQCRIGAGSVLAVADGALVEAMRGPTPAFRALTYQAFGK